MKNLYDLLKNQRFTVLLTGCLVATACPVSAQGVYNNGALLDINSGATLFIGGTNANYTNVTNSTDGRIDNEGEIILHGNWTNNASNNVFINRNATGIVNFKGSAQQKINGTTTTIFEDLSVNNTKTGNAVKLELNTEVGSSLHLDDGVVQTNGFVLIHSNPAAAELISFSDSGFINGNYRRYVGTNTDIYILPIGYDSIPTYYYRADFVNANLGGVTYLDCRVDPITELGNNIDSRVSTTQGGLNLREVREQGIWKISPDAAPSSGGFGVNLYVQNIPGISDNNFFVVKRPSSSVDYIDWNTLEGSTTIPPINNAGRIINGGAGFGQRTGYTSFSEFAIAQPNSTVSIDELTFTGKRNQKFNTLLWHIPSQVMHSTSHYSLEKSTNGIAFYSIAEFTSGLGSNLDLTYDDHQDISGLRYYRLKLESGTGEIQYSDIVSITNAGSNTMTVYPNPVNGGIITLKFDSNTGGLCEIELFDITGKKINHWSEISDEGTKMIQLRLGEMAKGCYVLKVKKVSDTHVVRILME